MENNKISFKHICMEDTYMFNYTQLPDELFTVELFKDLSLHAKVLYSFMLRRISLSKENSWFDEDGDVFIYYRTDEIMDKFNCSNKTASKIMAELEEIGLIEKKRQGQGKPDIIYVNKFSALEEKQEQSNGGGEEPQYTSANQEQFYPEEEQTEGESANCSEVKNVHFKKCKNYTSKNVKNTSLEVKKLHANYKDNNYKEKLSSTTTEQDILLQTDVIRRWSEEEEIEYREKIKYLDAVRLYSEDVALAVLSELMRRDQEYREKFTAEMFQKICKTIVTCKEPVLNLVGFINWGLNNISFSPPKKVFENSFNQFMQTEYDFRELEKDILSN